MDLCPEAHPDLTPHSGLLRHFFFHVECKSSGCSETRLLQAFFPVFSFQNGNVCSDTMGNPCSNLSFVSGMTQASDAAHQKRHGGCLDCSFCRWDSPYTASHGTACVLCHPPGAGVQASILSFLQ